MGIEPDIRAGVPNVPGGPIIDIVRLSPSFQLLLTQSLAVRVPSLLNAGPPIFFNDNSPLRNLPPVVNNVPGAVAIQTVEDTSRWLGQAGDPVAGRHSSARIHCRVSGEVRHYPVCAR